MKNELNLFFNHAILKTLKKTAKEYKNHPKTH